MPMRLRRSGNAKKASEPARDFQRGFVRHARHQRADGVVQRAAQRGARRNVIHAQAGAADVEQPRMQDVRFEVCLQRLAVIVRRGGVILDGLESFAPREEIRNRRATPGLEHKGREIVVLGPVDATLQDDVPGELAIQRARRLVEHNNAGKVKRGETVKRQVVLTDVYTSVADNGGHNREQRMHHGTHPAGERREPSTTYAAATTLNERVFYANYHSPGPGFESPPVPTLFTSSAE